MLTKPTRRVFFRRCTAFAIVVLPFASFAVANPAWAKSAGIDVWNVHELERELEVAEQTNERMAVADETILNRISAKEALVAALIADRLTLAEATSQFLSLNADRPDFVGVFRTTYPGDTDAERTARNVIDYVTQRVADPVARHAITCRLSAELVEMGHPHGVGY